ncbi:MAG: ribulokinase [Clostridiales bacterium]|nr:ribulokinase [Clostridiales bacterium]
MEKYAIGLDYGTLSGRAVLVRVSNGEQIASASMDYPHGVMDQFLPCGKRLPVDWALQHPQDYLDVLYTVIPQVVDESGVNPKDIIALGVDFTSSTAFPAFKDGTPLCFLPEYQENPHAYVKLWKHHGPQKYANRITQAALEQNQQWLNNYGGRVSCEWSIPKIWELLEEAPDIYEKMDHWIEAGDWIVWLLTGKRTLSLCYAGYKTFYNQKTGYPSEDFFASLHPRLRHVMKEKYDAPMIYPGERAGFVTEEMAKKLHLHPGVSVAAANIDAAVCTPAVGIDRPGVMLGILGTSAVHLVNGTEERQVPGMCGVVENGLIPGFYGYEAGQSCLGDHFAWLVKNCCPKEYYEKAREEGVSIHEYLTRLASRLAPGESGLIALDWWNGNRSVLVDWDLEGMMLGMTLQTTCEEMYRALIEATAYGARMIVENYRENGVPVDSFIASGGISQKNPMMMQIYADVLNMPIRIAGSAQGPALGAAIFGTVSAGSELGGYDDVITGARKMGQVKNLVYTPIPEHVAVYEKLFREYRILHDYFGRGANDVMKRIKEIKKQAR